LHGIWWATEWATEELNLRSYRRIRSASSPAESLPLAEDGGAGTPGLPLDADSGPRCHASGAPSVADSGGHAPQPFWAHPGSSRGLRLGSFTIHVWRTENSNPSGFPPTRFPTGAHTLTGSFSKAEGERIERPWGFRPNLRLATGCLATRPAFHCAPGGGRTLTPEGHWFLGPARLPISPPALGADTGNRTRVFTMAG
jgi:hypothetical protein